MEDTVLYDAEQRNIGCDIVVEMLITIARTGVQAGIFGSRRLEELAQAILQLRKMAGFMDGSVRGGQ